MPPVNSLTTTPPDEISASPYLEQLAELASPVPDFAATLTTQIEQDANDDNVSFLRTPPQHLLDGEPGPTERRRSSYITEVEFADAQRESQRRMRRAIYHSRRYTPAQLQELGDSRELIPSVGMPGHAQSGYQGWAPGSSDTEGDVESLAAARARLRSASAQLAASTARLDAEMNRAEMEHDLAATRRRLDMEAFDPAAERQRLEQIEREVADTWGQSHFVENEVGGEPTFTESSLRTTALLQSVRRHSRFSARSRNQLENYILERERLGPVSESRENANRSRPTVPTNETVSSILRTQEIRSRDLQARVHDLNRLLPQTSPTDEQKPSRLEKTINYLERLRFCDTYLDRILSAEENGFIQGEDFTHNHEDFILNTATIDPPQHSSWLKVGGVFSGSQHAASGSIVPPLMPASQVSRAAAADRRVRGGSITPAQTSRGSWITNTASRMSETDEQWPVKVTIHAIDYESMTLSGTMEAFNVPDKSSPTFESSITTFLEGEIIDFNKFALETKTFNAGPKVDATYWRKLGPFKKFTDDEMVRNLVSMKWLSEELSKKWILMRWKEKCFITPSDAQSGLTISGFYYVSLRRQDGHVEGLYHDPSSTPYQHLSLTPEKRTFPAYQFR